jgi:5-methylcytosine-specific restriction endonuclease McrA
MRVFVQNADGTPLMPCHPARARKLLRRERAQVVNMHPFVIRLTPMQQQPSLQPLEIGVDDGAENVGLAVVQRRTIRPDVAVFQGVIKLRTDVKKSLDDRRGLRRARRSRIRYRQPRFNNRPRAKCKVCGRNTPDGQALCRPHAAEGHHRYAHLLKQPGWIPPSIKARKDQTLRTVRHLLRWLPISTAHLEVAFFDTQALTDPAISGERYQYGPNFGHRNRKAAVLFLYSHTCQYCGETEGRMEIDHVVPRSAGGTDTITNLTCSCVDCNRKKGNRSPEEAGMKLRRSPKGIGLRLLDAAIVQAGKTYLEYELRRLVPEVRLVLGWMTNWWMKRMALPKHESDGKTKLHYTDALAMVLRERQPSTARMSAVVHRVEAGRRQTRQMFRTQAWSFRKKPPMADCVLPAPKGGMRRLLKITPNDYLLAWEEETGKRQRQVVPNLRYSDSDMPQVPVTALELVRFDRYDLVRVKGRLGRVSAILTNGSLKIWATDARELLSGSPWNATLVAKARPVSFVPTPVPAVSDAW